MIERVLCHRDDRLARNTAAPEPLAQPVSNLGGDAFDVLLQVEADAADGGAVHGNRKEGLRLHHPGGPDEALAILAGVRKREPIAEVDRDVPVIGVLDKGREIAGLPGTDLGVLERQAHHTRRPKSGRSRVPKALPANAATHPEPAVEARRRDAAEVHADVAAVGDARAVAEHEAAGDGCCERARGHSPDRRQPAGKRRGRKSSQHDAEVHHAGDVAEDAAVQLGDPHRTLPVGP